MDILYRWRDGWLFPTVCFRKERRSVYLFPTIARRWSMKSSFSISATEISGLPLNKAEAYARSKLPAYKGEKWKVLDSWQIEAAGQAQPELNRFEKNRRRSVWSVLT